MFAARGILARYLCGLLVAFPLSDAGRTSGKDAPSAPNADAPRFERDVRPILESRCFRCHGGQRKKADLDLTSLKGLLKGGESGPVAVPGKADKSLLYEMVHSGKMPPQKKARLSADELATIRRWLDAGMPATASPSQGSQAPAPVEITQQQIVPLMMRNCTVCHGGRERMAGLDLRTRAGMLKGGKSGPALVPGNPEASLLLKVAVPGDKHPLQRLLDACVRPMTADEIARLRTWIAHGAPEVPWQVDAATTQPDLLVSEQDRKFWAFQPPVAAAPPAVREAGRVRNPIDAFILKKLEEKGLTLAPEADRLTLLRRASFDLLGLPPSPDETQAFLADTAPDAYERMIDRLLASPRYGERWGRYWLDCTGYADSDGKRNVDPIRPFAYRYRDYVIRSFNADKPYDRFLLEQIAGDELADYEHGPLTPEVYDNLVATGFLRQVPDGTGASVVNLVPDRLDVIADQMEVFGATVLGLTLKCARCHSHKYDPIPQRDYYRLLAVFRGALDEYDWLTPDGRNLRQAFPEERARWQAHNRSVQEQIQGLRTKLDQLAKERQKASAEYRKAARETEKQVESLKERLLPEPAISGLWDRGQPSPSFLYRRGDYQDPVRLVAPGVPAVLTDGKTPFEVRPPWPDAKQTGRRLALARWLIRPEHPLTARVMVNRIVKHHFGQGIVKTLDNFGHTGTRPTHPELLDWLACEFVHQGWSVKAMHRLLMTSSTYRQKSHTPGDERLDADNSLLSRMPLKRMEAEVLYDTLLQVAGRLDCRPFGPPDPVEAREDGLVTPVGTAAGWRRAVYVLQRRKAMPTVLESFDLPQMNPNCVQRVDTTVPSQALYLRNNAQVYQLAGGFADRIIKEAGPEPTRQIDRAYWTALGWPPTQEEKDAGLEALAQFRASWMRSGKKSEEIGRKALTDYCHTIFNSAAFLYID